MVLSIYFPLWYGGPMKCKAIVYQADESGFGRKFLCLPIALGNYSVRLNNMFQGCRAILDFRSVTTQVDRIIDGRIIF